MKTNQLVSAQIFAELTGLSESKVYRLAKAGVIKRRGSRNGESGFPLRENLQALLAHVEASAKQDKVVQLHPGDQEDGKRVSTQELIEREQLEKLRRQNALARREYAPVDELRLYAEKVALVIRSGLEALPGQIRQRIPHLRAAEASMIESEVVKIAGRIADHDFREPATTD